MNFSSKIFQIKENLYLSLKKGDNSYKITVSRRCIERDVLLPNNQIDAMDFSAAKTRLSVYTYISARQSPVAIECECTTPNVSIRVASPWVERPGFFQ